MLDRRAATALLLVEFHGDDDAPLLGKLERAETHDGRPRLPGAVVASRPRPAFQAAMRDVRKAGLNIMMSMKGDGKPVSFIEDCAVPLDTSPTTPSG